MTPARTQDARAVRRRAGAALLLLALPACAGPARIAGLDPADPALAPDVAALVRAAGAGDKQAQLALGIRFEAGDGVARNSCQALELFRQAAIVAPRQTTIYVPGVPALGAKPGVQRVTSGSGEQGLPEARERAERLLKSGKCPQRQKSDDRAATSGDRLPYFTDAEFTQPTPPMPLTELLKRIVAVAKKNKEDMTLRDFMDAVRFEPPQIKYEDSQDETYYIKHEVAWFEEIKIQEQTPLIDKSFSVYLRAPSQVGRAKMTMASVDQYMSSQANDWRRWSVNIDPFPETYYSKNGVTIRFGFNEYVRSISVFIKP